jgi:hypothetical protein
VWRYNRNPHSSAFLAHDMEAYRRALDFNLATLADCVPVD